MYDAQAIAKYIIKYAREKKYSLSNLKLQKILYYIQGAFLVYKEEPCYFDELKNWKHGPVVSSVYREYKFFGSENIDKIEEKIEILNDDFDFEVVNINDYIAEEDKQLIEMVVSSLCVFSAWELVDKTHEEDPWNDTKQNEVISTDRIERYFNEHRGRLFGL